MRPVFRCALLGMMLFSFWGCSHKSAKLQKSIVPPDKTLFETGSEYLNKSQYIKARLAFQTLINTYPDSEMAAESYFKVADSFYDEGGTENLMQAEDQYKNFIIFFPAHPKAPDAQLKVVAANMKLMHSPDRDQQHTLKAESEARRFLDLFPDHDYAPIVRQYLAEIHENLAQTNFGVGKFYADKNNYLGAVGRFQENADKYAGFSNIDENYFRLADALQRINQFDQAAIYFAKIAEGYPFSKLFEEAKERLKLLNKPVPSVDTLLAALNQSRLKPAEGFSPLKPLIDFGKALGFVGSPDRYEMAKKTVEEEKIKIAQKEAAKVPEGGQTSEDILIQTTLRKQASGATQETTILGANGSDSQIATENKKSDSNKNKSKHRRRNKNVKKPATSPK